MATTWHAALLGETVHVDVNVNVVNVDVDVTKRYNKCTENTTSSASCTRQNVGGGWEKGEGGKAATDGVQCITLVAWTFSCLVFESEWLLLALCMSWALPRTRADTSASPNP